jgi:hypothetical protein
MYNFLSKVNFDVFFLKENDLDEGSLFILSKGNLQEIRSNKGDIQILSEMNVN